nr:hypothetical protein [Nocardia fluminea]
MFEPDCGLGPRPAVLYGRTGDARCRLAELGGGRSCDTSESCCELCVLDFIGEVGKSQFDPGDLPFSARIAPLSGSNLAIAVGIAARVRLLTEGRRAMPKHRR